MTTPIDPRTQKPFAYSVELIRPEWHAIDLTYNDTIAKLNSQLSGGSQVLAQSLDNRYWTVYTDESDRSPVYKVFDASTGELSELFVTNPSLNDVTLAKMHGVVIPSRDGMDLVSYLTLPVESDPDEDGRPTEPVPLVMPCRTAQFLASSKSLCMFPAHSSLPAFRKSLPKPVDERKLTCNTP